MCSARNSLPLHPVEGSFPEASRRRGHPGKPVQRAKQQARTEGFVLSHFLRRMFAMPQIVEIATVSRAVERIRLRASKVQAQTDFPAAARLSQPVLSEFECWREAAWQRRAFARRLKEA